MAFGQVVDCGLAWLCGRDEEPHWSLIWKSLFDAAYFNRDSEVLEQLAAKGLAWLGSRQVHPDWIEVFQLLPGRRRGSWTTSASKGEVGEVLGRWLRHPLNQPRDDWAFHLEQYSKAGFATEDLLEPLIRWLGSHQQNRHTPLMAAELLVRRIDRPELADAAEWLAGWLESHPGFVDERDIRELFRKRLKPGRQRPAGWERLAAAVTRTDATFRQVDELLPKWKAGEAVAGRIAARREGGFSVSLGLVTAYLPNRLLGAEPDDSWIGWEGLFEIEKIFLGPGLVIVARRKPWENLPAIRPETSSKRPMTRFSWRLCLPENSEGIVTVEKSNAEIPKRLATKKSPPKSRRGRFASRKPGLKSLGRGLHGGNRLLARILRLLHL